MNRHKSRGTIPSNTTVAYLSRYDAKSDERPHANATHSHVKSAQRHTHINPSNHPIIHPSSPPISTFPDPCKYVSEVDETSAIRANMAPLSARTGLGYPGRRRTVGRGLPPRAIHWDRRAAPQAKQSSPPPANSSPSYVVGELNRRGDERRLARYRGHNLTEEGPMGPTLRSSAAPDRSTPWDSDPRADLSLSHNAVGKFACNDEFAIITGSFCREPPPLRLALLRW